jgi:GNAT superfamily N-acetyltransferase
MNTTKGAQMKYKDLSPARQLYVKKQADKKGITLKEYLDAKYGTKEQVRKYPFTKIEDATFRLERVEYITTEMADLYNTYADEYGKDDVAPLRDSELREQDHWYLAKIGSHTVGFVMNLRANNKKGADTGLIENVYVKPAYRGWGVAERIYKESIRQGNTLITLCWARISTQKQQDYWSRVGFRSLHLMMGQASADNSLVYLSTEEQKVSPVQFNYPQELSLARFHCRNINTLIHKQMGFSPERTQINQHWQECESITQQYLAERGLLKVEA